MKVGAFITLICIILPVRTLMPWVSSKPPNMRGCIAYLTLARVVYMQSLLVLSTPGFMTGTTPFAIPLTNNNYPFACATMGVDMGSIIHYDYVITSISATGFIGLLTVLSSTMAISYVYAFDICILLFDISSSPYLSLQSGLLIA